MWLSEYIHSAEFRPMSKFELDYDSMAITNPDYLPLRFANQIIRGLEKDDHSDFKNCMLDKYSLFCQFVSAHYEVNPNDLSWQWSTLSLDNFNQARAERLYKEYLMLDGVDYVLINNHSGAGSVDIHVDSECLKVYMREVNGFTLLDWYIVIANAKSFHSVSTSTFFLRQIVKNRLGQLGDFYLYPRPNEDGLRGVLNLVKSLNDSTITLML